MTRARPGGGGAGGGGLCIFMNCRAVGKG